MGNAQSSSLILDPSNQSEVVDVSFDFYFSSLVFEIPPILYLKLCLFWTFNSMALACKKFDWRISNSQVKDYTCLNLTLIVTVFWKNIYIMKILHIACLLSYCYFNIFDWGGFNIVQRYWLLNQCSNMFGHTQDI